MSKFIVLSVLSLATLGFLTACGSNTGGSNRGAPKSTPRDISNEPKVEDPTKMNPGVIH